MVVFTCQHCNEALKKPVVEKHYNTKCRRNPYLTCVDCLKDFRGDEYISHTSCVSEDQRYGGKGFVPKPVAVKQNNWLEVVHSCIKNNKNPKFIPSFNRLINCSNIPRKKPKFINFMKSAMNMHNAALSEEIFDLFQKKFEESKNDKKSESNLKTTNGNDKTSDNAQQHTTEKKRNQLSETEVKDEELVNSSADRKKKKSKKQRTESFSDSKKPLEEVVPTLNNNGGVDDDSPTEKKSEKTKKKKKKNKDTQDKENLNESQVDNENNSTQFETPEADSPIQESGGAEKLSKKELKKLKKKQKYEAELRKIEVEENLKSNELQEETPCEQVLTETKSKKKKRKAQLSESELDDKKKQKTEELATVEEPQATENTFNETTTKEPNRKAKFHWDEVTKNILQNSSDHEISLKRLIKKVLSEYQSVKGDRESYEEFMSKFNKKINKIPGVKIIKDKARLVVQ